MHSIYDYEVTYKKIVEHCSQTFTKVDYDIERHEY